MATSVLVVDDEPDVRRFICMTLRIYGYEALEATNGREGLDMIEREQPEVMLLDLRMPELDGWQLLETLSNGGKLPLRVVVISTSTDLEANARAQALGCSKFMAKPFTTEELVDTLHKVLAAPEGS